MDNNIVTDDMWYFEYDVTIVEDDEEVIRQGIICAKDFRAAARDLTEYYDFTLLRINKLLCVMETVYEFNNAAAEYQVRIEE